jgi:hypothetical protein
MRMQTRTLPGFLTVAGFFLVISMLSVSASLLQAQEAAKREMLEDNVARFWIYDDITAGNSVAALTGQPLLVLFRCVT